MSVLHIPIVLAHDVSKQIPQEKNFPSGWKCYKTIGSYVSCVFINIWSTWEVWRALKKLELLLAMPWATLTHLSCSPNFPCASYLDECTLTYELIVNCSVTSIERAYNISLACEPFNSQDLISNSPYYLPHSSCDVSLENLVLDHLIIP